MRRLLLKLARLYAAPKARRFKRAASCPQETQADLLQALVLDLKLTEYGEHYGISTVEDFKKRLPVVTYDDLAPWVERQRRCEANVLVNGKVAFYEKTSGSTGPAKYIPYTRALRRSFTDMFLVWAADIIERMPEVGSGKLYFSISPSFDEERVTPGGVPVGLEDDAEYLGPGLKNLLAPFLLMPKGVSALRDPEEFKRRVSVALVGEANLRTISIWNPSFLRVLLTWIEGHRDEVLETLGLDAEDPRRSALMRDPVDWSVVWPDLKLISCWADGNAAGLAKDLGALFPLATVQGKGLLATEAPMTLPLLGVEGGVPMLTEVYFELLTPSGELLGLHEVERGETYEVVISTRGGLCRYRMGDRVKVVSRYEETPTFQFVGRGDKVSDLVGEKLNEGYVRDLLKELDLSESRFQCLMPVRHPEDRYVLVLDACEGDVRELEVLVESRLAEAFHYRHARNLDQLQAVRVVVEPRIESLLSEFFIRRGKRWGDMKSTCLLTTPLDGPMLEGLGLSS